MYKYYAQHALTPIARPKLVTRDSGHDGHRKSNDAHEKRRIGVRTLW